ncbi:BREX system P-loop protein BrxC [Rubrobacter marinus]|uniref:BREX system P-loop protein BrxC n=1 Tax=Rubrobacter marinus TaxID=2653852 RepID=UPI00140AC841|nr:BREX system P-loop protein BrxC [Rubrobacter marinus]
MRNREVFVKDPLKTTIPNDGVAKLGEPSTEQEWEVLRYELSTFVCKGEYERGLDKMLSSYLANLGKATQPAAWVSGFYGSGKSHLVRVLEFLWRDVAFPDGATAHGLVDLPDGIREHLRELTTIGRRGGGLWSVAGTLGAGAGDSVRLSILSIVLQNAGLPGQYAQGRFVLWLKQNDLFDTLKERVEADGRGWRAELSNLFVSRHIPRILLELSPGFASSEAEARQTLKAQYPERQDISDEELLDAMTEVLALQSGDRENPPCTLLVLDELQQYVGDNADRALRVQNVVEACSSRFGSRVLFVATGQSALQATPQLSRLQGRFTVRVPLADADVEQVVREVVLRKAEDKRPDLRRVLDDNSGEIDRQLSGTEIGPRRADSDVLIADYPLLPARRRFWERVLRATDRAGSNSQLRAQLRIVHQTTREVADDPVGTVVPADALYEHLYLDMISTGVLLRGVDNTIREQRDGTPGGEIRSRLCALIFLISQLPTEPGSDTGVRATVETLTDLLVEDLRAGGASLRASIPQLLEGMVESGKLMQVDGEYRLQTVEGAEWTAAYGSAYARIIGDDGRIANDRARELKQAVAGALKGLGFPQGESKTPRKVEPHFGADAPQTGTGAVPVWVRDEWSVGAKAVSDEARAAGVEDPTVYVFLPRRGADELKKALASYEAATEVLSSRATPSTREGEEARAAMESRQRRARAGLDAAIGVVLENARVLQGGGTEVVEGSLRAAVERAARASLERLYPQFRTGDHARWDAVMKRAREGSGSPLEPLGYEGNAESHPACSRILASVGAAGKRGRDVRAEFRMPPYGWPQDAVDGSLLTLLSEGLLRASQNGRPVTAKEVDGAKVGATEFRSETVHFTRLQLIKVRKLFADAGMQVRSGDELQAALAFLDAAIRQAEAAGGDAPLPAPPDTQHLKAMKSLSGNELLLALHNAADRLREEMALWKKAEAEIRIRLPRWRRLTRLLDHARPLHESDGLRGQAEAIRRERTLLDEPDPVQPLLRETADLLRAAVGSAHAQYASTFEAGLRNLEGSEAWRSLPAGEAGSIRAANGLSARPEPGLGTAEAVLDSLDRTSLSEWDSLIVALPERFARASEAAAKKLEPQAFRLRRPSATLKTAAEVDAYLDELRAEIMTHIEKKRPVIL